MQVTVSTSIVTPAAYLPLPRSLAEQNHMDPQATWQRLIDAYATGDFETTREAAEDLLAWLRRGGFPPQVLPDPWQMDKCWNRTLAQAACRFILSACDE